METHRRKYGPKSAGHPSIGEPCPVCTKAFSAGDYTTLIILGPGEGEDAKGYRENRAHNAVAVEVHWACATGRDANG